MTGDASCSCPLATLQTCSDQYNQPFLAHPHEFQTSDNLGQFHHFISCPKASLDETAALNNNHLPTSIVAVAEWSEVNMEMVNRIDQSEAGYLEFVYPCCKTSWPQSTRPSNGIQPRDPPSPGPSPSPRYRSHDSYLATTTKQHSQCSKSRNHGHQRLYRDFTNASMPPECSDKAGARRFIHNKVERKYREGINAEMKRLQRAVPTMQPRAKKDDETSETFRPSKAMILTGAIDYIKKLECERDAALEELDNWRNESLFSVWRRSSHCKVG
ncbi:uncharacterized protein ALTATR162_LOCUS464 [Alternaria atra]|uniref:BHLH domain-containing protein n=1 Tax=Alternaria atra TaxID=119953 RepID=A0A8J2N1F3_9PLEO|nr:uncharacterized protein ALTATR162_LOCUS464 [Alternaria atra]CAG5139317.1 unnamed protein product [Alternaria atra]